MKKTTILIEASTRNKLKKIGKKGQSYDRLIRELIRTQRSDDSLESRFEILQSNEPVNNVSIVQ